MGTRLPPSRDTEMRLRNSFCCVCVRRVNVACACSCVCVTRVNQPKWPKDVVVVFILKSSSSIQNPSFVWKVAFAKLSYCTYVTEILNI